MVGKIILGIVGRYLVLQVAGYLLNVARFDGGHFQQATEEAQDGLDRAEGAKRHASETKVDATSAPSSNQDTKESDYYLRVSSQCSGLDGDSYLACAYSVK